MKLSSLVFAIGLATTAAYPAAAQTTAVVDKAVTSPDFQLAPYERFVRFSNGCGMLAITGETELYGQSRWYGGCRAGLADGEGLMIYDGQYSDGKFYRYRMRLGRIIWAGSVGGHFQNYVVISRGPTRAASETVNVQDKLEPQPGQKAEDFVLYPYGNFGSAILANKESIDDRERRTDYLWIAKALCPIPYGSMDKAIASEYYGQRLTPAQRAQIVPICSKAVNRAKSEGIINDSNSLSISASSAFERVTYGFYFVLYVQHTITQRKGSETGVYTGQQITTYADATLCPQITSATGCESVWRAMQAPFIQKRNELIAVAAQAEADDTADRERRAAGAIQRVNDFARKLAAETPDYVRPPAPQAPAPATAGKKKP